MTRNSRCHKRRLCRRGIWYCRRFWLCRCLWCCCCLWLRRCLWSRSRFVSLFLAHACCLMYNFGHVICFTWQRVCYDGRLTFLLVVRRSKVLRCLQVLLDQLKPQGQSSSGRVMNQSMVRELGEFCVVGFLPISVVIDERPTQRPNAHKIFNAQHENVVDMAVLRSFSCPGEPCVNSSTPLFHQQARLSC